jgi:hypothetical protein
MCKQASTAVLRAFGHLGHTPLQRDVCLVPLAGKSVVTIEKAAFIASVASDVARCVAPSGTRAWRSAVP